MVYRGFDDHFVLFQLGIEDVRHGYRQVLYKAAIIKSKQPRNDPSLFSLFNVTTYPRMRDVYHIVSIELFENTANRIATDLAACEIIISKLVYLDVKSPSARRTDATYSNFMNDRDGVMICSENIKSQDENAPNGMLWPSEILWQSWSMVANAQGSQPSNLKAIVRYTIVNESTQRVIWQVAKLSTCTKEDTANHTEYTELDQGYHAIL